MPNHIQNLIEASSETMQAVRKLLVNAEGRVDFNRLVKMPADGEGFKSRNGLRMEEHRGKLTNWYEWSCHFWGTKWNAYQCPDRRDTPERLYFQTAWAMPEPIFFALAARVRDFTWYWADEDFGRNLGGWRVDSVGDVWLSPRAGMPEGERDREEWAMRLHAYDGEHITR